MTLCYILKLSTGVHFETMKNILQTKNVIFAICHSGIYNLNSGHFIKTFFLQNIPKYPLREQKYLRF